MDKTGSELLMYVFKLTNTHTKDLAFTCSWKYIHEIQTELKPIADTLQSFWNKKKSTSLLKNYTFTHYKKYLKNTPKTPPL